MAFDIIVVGGGATGVGVAIDAASRGYDTLLVEGSDFGKGTSSRSTKLVHGGVRYLEQGNISLVMEALKERGILRQNAPHLVSDLAFIVPSYDWWEAPFYGLGLKIYNILSGQYGFAIVEPVRHPGNYDQEFSIAAHHWEPSLAHMGPQDNGWEIAYQSATLNSKMLGAGEPLRVRQGERVLFRFLNASATDGIYTRGAGVPTYGVAGIAVDRDDMHAHGRDERVRVAAFYRGNEFFYRYLEALTVR